MSVIRTEFCPWRFEEPRLFLHNVDVLLKNRGFPIWIVFLLSSFCNIRLVTMYNQGGISYNQAPATLDDIKALLKDAISCYNNVIKPFSKNSGNFNEKMSLVDRCAWDPEYSRAAGPSDRSAEARRDQEGRGASMSWYCSLEATENRWTTLFCTRIMSAVWKRPLVTSTIL